jgi:hypothetical protein
MSKNKKFKPNDEVLSSSWRNEGIFKVINADDPTKVVIENYKIRAIVKSNDLTLIEKKSGEYIDYGSIKKLWE